MTQKVQVEDITPSKINMSRVKEPFQNDMSYPNHQFLRDLLLNVGGISAILNIHGNP